MDTLHALCATHGHHPRLAQDVHARPQVAPLQLAGAWPCKVCRWSSQKACCMTLLNSARAQMGA